MLGIGLLEMLDHGDRDIVDLEAHRRLGMQVEGVRQRRADRAAMRRRHDVAAFMLGGQPVDAAHGAVAQVDEALAALGPELRRSQPEQMVVGMVLGDLDIGETLPLAEMLLGEIGIDVELVHLGAGPGEMLGGLARAQQVGGVPDRALGQQLRLVTEQFLVAHVAVHVRLAVAAALRIGDHGMPHPPPPRDRSGDLRARRHALPPILTKRPSS